MPLTKSQKEKILNDLKEKISRNQIMVFVDFCGIKVKDILKLRKKLKEAVGELKVVKKTLLNLALKEKKVQLKKEDLKGEIAIAFGYQDVIKTAKIVYDFSKENPNLKILGGIFEGEVKGAKEIVTLAQIPSKEELLARLVGSISSPISGFINVFKGNIKGLLLVLSQITKK